MVFNSPIFLIFLAICAIIFYMLPHKARNIFLLLASYVFYFLALPKAPQYLLLILGTTVLVFFVTKFISTTSSQKARKAAMLFASLTPLLVLLVFKYFNFFMTGVESIFSLTGLPSISWLLPIGISFYTFQIIGYVIDVYNKKIEPEKNFFVFALFVSFFAQILSGPIGRANEMLPQYHERHDFKYSNITQGLQRFLLGAFKKCVIADGVARIVNGVYVDLITYSGLAILMAVLLYGIQIYMDFSGYSDMAVGVGRLFGFSMRENFNAPYMATNMSGFWKRWHMSLTTWFNDYIFTPLVWSRWANKLAFGKKWEEHAPHFMTNIMIVFLLSGLWHGASVTYVIWGLINGAVRIIEELIAKRNKKLKRKKKKDTALNAWLKRGGVFLLFSFTLIFFRSPNIADAIYVITNLFRWMPINDVLFYFAAMTDEKMIDGALYYAFFWFTIVFGIYYVTKWDKWLSDSLTKKGESALMNPLSKYTQKKRWTLYWLMGLTTAAFYMMSTAISTVSFIYVGY